MMTIYSQLGSSLLLEWAADDPTTIYEDIAGTAVAANGDLVASWRSTAQGSLSLLATQDTSVSRPTYRSNYASSGHPAIEFDGVNDGLIFPHDASMNITDQTIFAVVTSNSTAGYRMMLSHVSNTGWSQGIVLPNVGQNISMWLDGVEPSRITVGTERRVVAARYDGQNAKMWRDDSQIDVNARAGVVTAHSQNGGIGNGGQSGGPYPWDGAIHHLLWCSGACSRGVIDYVVNALGDRWGIAIEDHATVITGVTGLSGIGRLGT